MRKWWGVALLAAAAAICFLLFTQPAGKEAGLGAPQGTAALALKSSEIADAGNRTVAVLSIYLVPDGSRGRLIAFCTQKPLQKSTIILSHPSVPGVPEGMAKAIASKLAFCGLSSRQAGAEDAASSKNAVIIAPTGAVPSELADRAESIGELNSRAIVLLSLAGRGIDALGRIGSREMPQGFETVPLAPGEEEAAAAEAAREALVPKETQPLIVENPSGNLTLALPAWKNATSCRAVYLSEKSCRFSDSQPISAQQGRLAGPEKLLAGHPAVFEFSLPQGAEVGRELRFFAVFLLGKDEAARREIAGGRIAGGWASAFAVNLSRGGRYVIRIVDQFSRVHAAAYADVQGLEVEPVRQSGTRYEFYAKFGGEPATGMFEAWLDSGGRKQYYSSNGTLVVFASPPPGRHTMHFSFSGLEASWEFESLFGGPADAYLRLGVPALAFLAVVFFLLKAGKRTAYTITFPEFAAAEARQVGADGGDFAKAWAAADRKMGGHRLPMQPEEIGKELAALLGMKDAAANTHSVLSCLRELCREGAFAECGAGFFIPKGKMGGFGASQLFSLRMLHDIMLERGVRFARRERIAVKERGIELAVFFGKGRALAKMGRLARVLIFATQEEKEAFEKSLGTDLDSTRIKIAISNGKLRLAAATRQELEALLP